ncbi:calcium-binding protein [Phaeobacter marinintestinus]|uniref:calcium-binding protein n=1 Tax=Falsiphaeobacter marinintestinus TaxID=1492905 RepID=UPI0011B5F036|nr:M10 family metallopeptidase C-terminal domain-containing protein [Phaeobacter marinintestinus]
MSLIEVISPIKVGGYTGAYPQTVQIISYSHDDFLISYEQDHGANGLTDPFQFIGQLFNVEHDRYVIIGQEDYTGWGNLHDTTPLAGGGFAVSWVHETSTQDHETYVQVYANNGDLVGGPFSFGTNSDHNALTQLSNGNLAVVYEGASNQSYLQIVDLTGATVLAETQISLEDNAEVTSLNTGGFAVLFENSYVPTIMFFDAAGTALTAEIPIATHASTFNVNVAMTTLASGSVLVAWEGSGSQGPDDFGVYARIFDANGTPQGTEFLVSEDLDYFDGAPNVAALDDGGFLISYSSTTYSPSYDTGTFIQRYDVDGYAVGHPYEVTGAAGNEITMAQNDYNQIYATYASGQDVMMQIFDAGVYGTGFINTIAGDGDDNVIFGLGAADTLSGLNGNDTLVGGAGHDTLFGNAGSDALEGCDGLDRLLGGADDDLLRGGAGNDALNGGADQDVLQGDLGRDTLTGGSEADVFRFLNVSDSTVALGGRDIIGDFEDGVDLIDLSLIDAGLATGNQAFTFIGTAAYSGAGGELRFTQSPNTTVLRADIDGDGQDDMAISIRGINALDATDFIL